MKRKAVRMPLYEGVKESLVCSVKNLNDGKFEIMVKTPEGTLVGSKKIEAASFLEALSVCRDLKKKIEESTK
jgi:acylphosphatase